MMKKLLFTSAVMLQFVAQSQNPVFSPTSSISTYGSVSSPAAEMVAKIIDGNINTKFLDFIASDGIGFTVNLNGVLSSPYQMKFTTANDFPQRDPMNYQIFGSTNGTNFTLITSGSIVCNATRFNTTTYDFVNTQAYSYYRFIFTNQCNTSEAMFQIAEVQLIHNALSNEKFTFENDFTLHPNPNNGQFTLSATTDRAIDLVSISDVSGKLIKQLSYDKVAKAMINLEGLATGVYFVQITSGERNVVKKIMVE